MKVWHRCRHPAVAGVPRRVVFVSNAARACPLWAQRAAPAPGEPVVWDYHVFLVEAGAGGRVWDLDSVLGMPVPLADYLAATFRAVPAEGAPRFRVVPAGEYVRRFSSDRSHMRTPDGGWLVPPPAWPAIGAAGETSNLMRFVDVEGEGEFVGRVVGLEGRREGVGGG